MAGPATPKYKIKEHPALVSARALYARAETEGSKSVEAETEALYYRVFGEALKPCNCKDRIGDALIVIITHLKKTNKTMDEKKYILKRGVVIHWKGDTYTRMNITDKVAKEWVKQFPDANVWEKQPQPTAPAEAESGQTAPTAPQTSEEIVNDAPAPESTEAPAEEESGKVVEL